MIPAIRRAAMPALLALAAAAATAQPAVDRGRVDYEANCASCHGRSGRGDGPLKPFLVQPPADLTALARRNGGAFPTQLVWEAIDGRAMARIGSHGTSEMPVWGSEFRAQAQANPRTAEQSERQVRDRIVALLDHLARLQEK